MKGKRIAVIGPRFFGYCRLMARELCHLGAEAVYFPDIPSQSNIIKAVGRINRRMLQPMVDRWFRRTLLPAFSETKFTEVIVILGMTFSLSKTMLQLLRQAQPGARFILYQWDSVANFPLAREIDGCFDSLVTFERADALADSRYRFLPTFYTPTFERRGKSEIKDFDVAYIGTAHPNKFRAVNRISSEVSDLLPRHFIFHYMPSALKYWYHKILQGEFRDTKLSDFRRTPLSVDEVADTVSRSRCVIDAPQTGQSGLTLRTYECMATETKLITTNADIANYDFYNPVNILIYDGKINPASPFFTEPYEPLPSEIFEAYSLRSWLRKLLE